jgi:hypothetical protein
MMMLKTNQLCYLHLKSFKGVGTPEFFWDPQSQFPQESR